MQAANSAAVSFGKPITSPILIPVDHKSTPSCISEPFMVNGTCCKVTAISFGTPHGVVIVDDVDDIDVSAIGSALGTHALFPKGASIVFVQITGKDSLKARLWQRGQGETPYSSEAVCAVATVAMMLQKIMGYTATVSMGENTFLVEWDRVGEVMLTELEG